MCASTFYFVYSVSLVLTSSALNSNYPAGPAYNLYGVTKELKFIYKW